MPSDRHEALVRDVCAAGGVERRGFNSAIRRAVCKDAWGVGEDDLDLMELLDEQKFIPDAYCVRPAEREIHVFEIEIASPLTDAKLSAFAWLWFAIDDTPWALRVFVVDRYAQMRELDMRAWYYRLIVGEAFVPAQ